MSKSVDFRDLLTRYNIIPFIIIILGLSFYLKDIDGWLMHDDEGSYLYAVWRISEGEVPYRDFLSPQLPLFLYLGATLCKIFGPSVFVMRAFTTLTVFLTSSLIYLTAKRVFNHRVGLLSMLVFVMHPHIYWRGRLFLPEAYMLLFATMGIYVFVLANLKNRWWGFSASGALFALATLCKLFGFLPLAGCLLFMSYEGLSGRAELKQTLKNALALIVAYAALVGMVFAVFYLLTPHLYEAVLGHHLMQGAELTRWQVFRKGLQFYWTYFLEYPLFLLLTIPAIVRSFLRRDRLTTIFVWQLPTGLSLLFLSRTLKPRHLVYLVPVLCILFASSLESLLLILASPSIKAHLGLSPLRSNRVRWALILLLTAVIAIPFLQTDRALAESRLPENDTWRLADYIQAHTQPDDYILSDYPGLSFYAQRRTTYLGASISQGATTSGQITGQELVKEIEDKGVKMILLHTWGGAPPPHQLIELRDSRDFRHYVETHFHLVRGFNRSGQLFQVYHAEDLNPITPLNLNFDYQLTLRGYGFEKEMVEAGEDFGVILRWQSQQEMERDHTVFLHLVDNDNHLWGQLDMELEDCSYRKTSQWPAGEIYEQGLYLPMLIGTPPGRYRVRIGLYQKDTGESLNFLDENQAPAGTAYTLGEVTVTRPSEPLLDDPLIQHPLSRDLGDRVRLLGYDLVGDRVKPGDTVHLTLFWQALREMGRDYNLLLQIQNEDGYIGAQRVIQPANDTYPTSQWGQGEAIRGQYDLTLDAAAPAGEYGLTMNLVDSDTGQALVEDDLLVTTLHILASERRFAIPEGIQRPMPASLGDDVLFLGYDLMATGVEPGGTLRLTLYWQAKRQMDISYTVFTHLLDKDSRIGGQKDNIPCDGTRPTTGWVEGEVIVDEYDIVVQSDAPPGEYVIEVGMYEAETGQRLPVLDEGGQVQGDRVLLGKMVVE